MSHNAQNTHVDEALTGRYASSIGWDPHQKPARSKATDREIEAAAKKARYQHREREALRTAIEVKSARKMLHDAPRPKRQPSRPLFPPFWNQGELAVLLAPPNDDASILAVQLAQTLANGGKLTTGSPPYEGGVDAKAGGSRLGRRGGSLVACDQVQTPTTHHSPLSTLYLDLHRTPRQYRERYTAGGKRYRFSKHLEFGFIAATEIPDAYKGQTEKFLRKAVGAQLADTDADVVIIDNLSWLTRSTGNSPELRSFLRSLRRFTNQTGKSILLIAPADPGIRARKNSPPYEGGVPGRAGWFSTTASTMAEYADSVFALRPSTFSPDHRYIKQLSSSSSLPLASANGPNQHETSSPPYEGGVDAASADGVVLSMESPVQVYQLQATPFPSFSYVGISEESQHTHDYAADIRKLEAALQTSAAKQQQKRQRQIRRSAKEAIAEGFLDGSYTNYLLGP